MKEGADLSASDLDDQQVAILREIVSSQHVSVLIGAGASIPSGMPSWHQLARSLVEAAGLFDGDTDSITRLLNSQDPLMVAELVKANVNDEPRWRELLRSSLYESQPTPSASAVHLAVARLVVERASGSTSLLTLNFDVLLEDALRSAYEELRSGKEVASRSVDRRPAGGDLQVVHHLHGVVSPDGEDEGDVVLSLSEFVGLGNDAWQFHELQLSLQQGPLLIAGSSYSDPDMRQWIWTLTKNENHHAVVALIGRADTGLTSRQFESARDALSRQWESIGVHPVFLPDFADPAQLVLEGLSGDDPKYQPPSRRLSSAFALVLAEFERFQDDHAAVLASDLEVLRTQLGDESNVTLWLCDGTGQLVRWASADRRYRAPELLRRIPIQNESRWISSEAAARNEIIAREPSDDPDLTRRWRSVVAAPITVDLPHGPPVLGAILSSATPSKLGEHDIDAWSETLKERANGWTVRLEELARRQGSLE